MTELAVIAPVNALSPVQGLKYQWALTSKLDNENYKRFFLHMSDSDKHVTLMQDDRIKPFLLAQYAEDIGAREIVLPYAKDKYNETAEIAKEYLQGMAVDRDSAEILRSLRPHIMIVPQGEDEFAWAHCLKRVIEIYLVMVNQFPKLYPFAPVIGIRAGWLTSLEPELELPHVRFVLKANLPKFQYHLLDWNTLSTFGIQWRSISTMVPFIRASGLIFSNGTLLNRRFTEDEQERARFFINGLRKRV